MIIPYGLDRPPRDPRVRCVEVGAAPLRLNSEPVPAEAMPLATGDHAARVAAAIAWLHSQCGDYAPLQRQFITAYFDALAAQVDAHRTELAERLRRFDGLYAADDFLWSALRPLPRAWVPVAGKLLPADIAFWDGAQVMAAQLGARETEKERALQSAGIRIVQVGQLEIGFDEALPSSPFRRPVPPPLAGGG